MPLTCFVVESENPLSRTMCMRNTAFEKLLQKQWTKQIKMWLFLGKSIKLVHLRSYTKYIEYKHDRLLSISTNTMILVLFPGGRCSSMFILILKWLKKPFKVLKVFLIVFWNVTSRTRIFNFFVDYDFSYWNIKYWLKPHW